MTNLLWQRLQSQLEAKVVAFPGVAGIALLEAGEGLAINIHAEEIFPTASTIKIHVLAKLLQRAEAGELDLTEYVTIAASDHVLGSGVIAYLNDPVSFSLRDLATLMMIASDNTATNLCIDQAGMEGINTLIHELGLVETTLRRKMVDPIATMADRENVATPGELVTMLDCLRQGKPSTGVAEQTLAIMQKHNYGFIDRGIPSTVMVANKPGWIEGVMCDAALVYLPRRPYMLAVMTKHALCDAVAQELFIVDISATVYATMDALDRSSQYGRRIHAEEGEKNET